jgi:hypothetical protein
VAPYHREAGRNVPWNDAQDQKQKSDECPAGGGASFAATRIRNEILRLLGSGIDQHCHLCISCRRWSITSLYAKETRLQNSRQFKSIWLISRSAFWIACDSLTGVGIRHTGHARGHSCGSLSCDSAKVDDIQGWQPTLYNSGCARIEAGRRCSEVVLRQAKSTVYLS